MNIPKVKLGIIAVSRDCFPISLSIARREAIVKAYDGDLYECPVTVENEKDALSALADVEAAAAMPWWYFWVTLVQRLRRPCWHRSLQAL